VNWQLVCTLCALIRVCVCVYMCVYVCACVCTCVFTQAVKTAPHIDEGKRVILIPSTVQTLRTYKHAFETCWLLICTSNNNKCDADTMTVCIATIFDKIECCYSPIACVMCHGCACRCLGSLFGRLSSKLGCKTSCQSLGHICCHWHPLLVHSKWPV